MSTPTASAPPADFSPSVFPRLRFAFLTSLVLPVIVLAFFDFAPRWLDRQLHAQLAARIQASPRLTPADKTRRVAELAATDFSRLTFDGPPELAPLRATLDQLGATAHFRRLRWGLRAAWTLAALVLGAAATTFVLNRYARRSPAALIRGYRLGWRLGMSAAVLQLLLLGPLVVYVLFEAMVIYDGTYNLRLLGLYAIMAGFALWKTAVVLVKPVPLEFTEPMSRAVTPAEAPEFWAAVREAATCLGTAPPDHIVIGMRMSFYVTELAVIHSAGRVEGRTLFLSQPLLRHLSAYEMLAIVGHELGHFLGDDTRLTREFYPLREKVRATMHTLRDCGPGAWTSIQSLDFLSLCFAATTQAFSRQRELLADRIAADMTSPETVARALVKFHVVNEAFDLGFAEAIEDGAPNPYHLALGPLIRERLLPAPEFWVRLFERALPHPLDSHPDLHARLAALGQAIGPEEARAMAIDESASAYAEWFAQRASLFTRIAQEADTAVGAQRTRQLVARADDTTAAGRQLLAQHLPERRFGSRMSVFWLALALLGVVGGGLTLGAVVVAKKSLGVAAVFGGFAALAGLGALVIAKRHRWAELVVSVDGLNHSHWREPLPFAEVEGLSLGNNFGFITLTLRLKRRRPPPWDFALRRWPRRALPLVLTWFDEDPHELAELIHRYRTRQLRDD